MGHLSSYTRANLLVSGLLIMGCLALCSSTAQAQAKNYQLFRVDIGASIAHAHGPGSWGGGGFVEPKFNLLDQLAVGMRVEGVAMFGGSIIPGEQTSIEMQVASAFLAKADWYFTTSSVRPFAGIGLGMHYLGGQTVQAGTGSAGVSQSAGAYFGLAPQVGIQLGAFRLAFTYNAIIGSAIEVKQTVGVNMEPFSVTRNYFTIELGGRIGGKRRPPRIGPAVPPPPPPGYYPAAAPPPVGTPAPPVPAE